MYDRIIVPIEEGAGVASVAAVLPFVREIGSALTLLHVHHTREAPPELEGLPQYRYQGVVESWDGRDQDAEAHEVEWLRGLADRVAAEEGRAVTSRVVHAPLSRRLRSDGESVLVVLPIGDLGASALDPTARELIHRGGVPVLLLPAGVALSPLSRILIALDGSAFSEEALEPALALARAAGARVSLVEVVTRSRGILRMLRPGERSAESAARFLHRVRSEIPDSVGPVDVRVVKKSSPVAGITQEARRSDAGLVAMATHGRGGLRRLMLGSVAEGVVRTTPVPVLLYRPAGAAAGLREPEPRRSATL